MKCKDCKACEKGYFGSKPNEYVCIGVSEPFVIENINSYCTEHTEKKKELWSWNETYSDDWTHGTFDSREEAIEDALAIKEFYNRKWDTIKIGKCELVPLRTDVDPERIMDYLDELYCDETGCDYYIYEGVTDEQVKWLEDKLSDVMKEFHKMIGLNPCWFTVVEQEVIDLEDYKK